MNSIKEKVIVFGVGNNWKIYGCDIKRKYEVIGYIDNNYEKLGCDVKAVETILNVEYDKVIVMPNYYDEMVSQLITLGVSKEKIIVYRTSSHSYERETIGTICYGQHYEDLIIAAIFGQIGVEKPSYMDLGANHPLMLSNTALLYEGGCRGINIEANPNLISEFNRLRPEDINLNIGISTTEGVLPYYKFDESSGLNTFSKREADAVSNDLIFVKEIVELPAKKLSTVIDKYCNKTFPDFLDCDIEGLDYDVLNDFDLLNNGPKVACIEVRKNEIEKFDEMMEKNDYFRFCRMGANNIYVKNIYRPQLLQMN